MMADSNRVFHKSFFLFMYVLLFLISRTCCFVVFYKIIPYLFIRITHAGLKMKKSDQDNPISLFKPVFIDFKALYGSIILFL